MALHCSAPTETVRDSFERWLAARWDGAAVADAVPATRGRPGRNLLVDAAVTQAVRAVRRRLLNGAPPAADRDAMIPHHQTLTALLDGR